MSHPPEGLLEPDLDGSDQEPYADDRRSMSLRGAQCRRVRVTPSYYTGHSVVEGLQNLPFVVLYEFAHQSLPSCATLARVAVDSKQAGQMEPLSGKLG